MTLATLPGGEGGERRWLDLRACLLACAVLLPLLSHAAGCTWESVAAKHQLNPRLLYAIAQTESRLNPLAFNRNKNGSRDIGMMQINSSWLPLLARHGISEADLYDACVSLDVGAWILAKNQQSYGNTWEAVGAYNARSPALRARYAESVYRQLVSTPGSRLKQ